MFGKRTGLLLVAEGTAAPSGAQATTAAPAAATTAPAAAATTAPASGDAPPLAADGSVDPSWLNTRLERERAKERTKLLKEIGVSDPAAAAKLVADETARVAAARTLEQRAIDAEQARDAEKARVATLSGTVSAIATERMTGLTEQQRAAVAAIAGDDAAAQLKAIAALAPTWGAPAQGGTTTAAAATATTTTTAATPAAAAATTAPGQTAPAGTTTTSQPDHKAEYKRLKAENPVQAAAYLNKHESQIYPRA